MLTFNELKENADGVYDYHVARKVGKTHLYRISNPAKQDIAVAFSPLSQSGFTSTAKRVWFGTVSAIKQRKGGAVIRDLGDPGMMANTIGNVVDEFFVARKANAVMLRVNKVGSGKLWDVQLKRVLKKYRLKAETTQMVANGESDIRGSYSFFVISRASFNPDTLFESEESTIRRIASMMAQEPDPAFVTVSMAMSDVPGAEFKSEEAIAQWMEDEPPRVVTNSLQLTLGARFSYPQTIIGRKIEAQNAVKQAVFTDEDTQRQVELLLSASEGAIELDSDPIAIANKLMPMVRNIDMSSPSVARAVKKLTAHVGRAQADRTRNQYADLSAKLVDDYADKISPEERTVIKEYTGLEYESINEALMHGTEDSEYIDKINTLDNAFSSIGMNMGNLKPRTMLYRGLPMDNHVAIEMVKNKSFASLAFMSSSMDPMTASQFAELYPFRLVASETEPADFVNVLRESSAKECGVVFIIDPEGVPGLIPGDMGVAAETEVIINRGVTFRADPVSISPDGKYMVVRLSVADKKAYVESVLGMVQANNAAVALEGIADMISVMEFDEEDIGTTCAEKQRSPIV
ncbi:Alt-like RNA polymerase ADP-ribosyltransferase [Vibrio phage D479]